jgi:hypothetical protein
MALTPYQQAYILSGKKMQHLYDNLLKKAYSTGIALPTEELANSSFNSIALDYYTWQQDHQRHSEATETDKRLKEIFGEDWKEKARQTLAQYESGAKQLAPVN